MSAFLTFIIGIVAGYFLRPYIDSYIDRRRG